MKVLSTILLAVGGGFFGFGIFAKRVLPAEYLEPLGGRGVILVAFLVGGLLFGAGFLIKQRTDQSERKRIESEPRDK